MKKILFVSSALGGGGAERVLCILANFFNRKKFNVKIITLISPRQEYEVDSNIKHLYVGGGKNKFAKLVGRYLRLKKEIQKFDADIVISFGWAMNIYTLLACIGSKRKVIISERNDPKIVPGNIFLSKIRDILYRRANYMVFQTEEAKEFFKFSNEKNSTIIENPIIDGLPQYNEEIKEKYVLAIGRLHPQKNFTLLMRAFAKFNTNHPDYELIVVGEGPEKDKLIEETHNLDISTNVKFLPFCNDIHDFLKNCAMYVSSSNFEGISNSMLESLAIGVPTICTDCPVGGARMYIQNFTNGILVPVGNEESLRQAMDFMANNREQAIKMGEAASSIKKDLSIDFIGDRWRKIVEKIEA
ncbi:glycosyltransferase [Priestia aryabhattai]